MEVFRVHVSVCVDCLAFGQQHRYIICSQMNYHDCRWVQVDRQTVYIFTRQYSERKGPRRPYTWNLYNSSLRTTVTRLLLFSRIIPLSPSFALYWFHFFLNLNFRNGVGSATTAKLSAITIIRKIIWRNESPGITLYQFIYTHREIKISIIITHGCNQMM